MDADALSTIGSELQRLRVERGLSMRHVAELVGVTHSRLREWEIGIDNHSGRPVLPPFDAVRRLARLYAVPSDGLLRLAGYGPEPLLPSDEQHLLAVYRCMDDAAREALLRELEERYGRPGERPPE